MARPTTLFEAGALSALHDFANSADEKPTMRFLVRNETADELEIDVYDIVGGSFFYGGVTAQDVRRKLKEAKSAKLIKLRINSDGGDVFDGFAIYNLLVQHPARVEVVVDGVAASIASVIAMAGDEIRMPPTAYLMIHNAWAGIRGEAVDLRRMADLLDGINETVAGVYAERSGQSAETMRELMQAETWLKGAQAKELGLIDTLMPAKSKPSKASARAFAALKLDRYSNVPDDVRAIVEESRRATPPTLEPEETAKPDEDEAEERETVPETAEPPAKETPSESPAPQPAETEETASRQLDLTESQPAPAPAEPQPKEAKPADAGRETNDMSEKKTDDTAVLALLQALGMESREQLTARMFQLTKLEALTGKTGDEALGVVRAWQAAAGQVTALTDRLDAMEKKAEAADVEKAFEAAKQAKKLTPYLEAALRKDYEKEDGMSAASLIATLEALPRNHALASETRQAPVDEQQKFNGKTYAEMTGPERHRLFEADRELFNVLRQQAMDAGLV